MSLMSRTNNPSHLGRLLNAPHPPCCRPLPRELAIMTTSVRSAAALFISGVVGLLSFSGVINPISHQPAVTLPASAIPSGVLPPIQRLQSYLQIRTDHPFPDYYGAIAFLNQTVAELLPDATVLQVELLEGKPILLVTVAGKDPELPALLLNSHTDVVPAEKHLWRWDPFAASAAFVSFEWRIYARGSQDMKCVGMQYLEALSQLTRGGWKPERNIVVSFVPDEEIGGVTGLGTFVDRGNGALFKSLNIGAALDEGLPNPKQGFNVYYGERQTWFMVVEAVSNPGHGALSPETSAGQMMSSVMSKALRYRAAQRELVEPSAFDNHNFTDMIGVNVVFMESGIPSDKSSSGFVMNMIPSKARCGIDIRVPPHVPYAEVDAEIESWMACDNGERCPGLTYKFVHRIEYPEKTSEKHPAAMAFMRGLSESRAGTPGPVSHPGVFFAATDIRFLREAGVPSIGFSPMELMPALLHKHDEYITVEGYLAGIRTYRSILQAMGGHWDTNTTELEAPSGEGEKIVFQPDLSREMKAQEEL